MEVLTVDYTAKNASALFTESLKNTGFAVLTQHPISIKLINEVYAEWKNFFASDEKHQYTFDRKAKDGAQHGYFPYLSETAKYNGKDLGDLKEFFHFYLAGQLPETFGPATRELFLQLSALAANLLDWVEEHTPSQIRAGFSMPLKDMIKDSPQIVLRILNYPPLQGNEQMGALRAAPHEDIDLLTLLPAATATGLQVKDVKGNWHDVSCEMGTIVVNAGDMLQLCSQGHYRSTTHQVINPEGSANVARLSMPLFLHPKADVKLSDTHTQRSYLNERLGELGLL